MIEMRQLTTSFLFIAAAGAIFTTFRVEYSGIGWIVALIALLSAGMTALIGRAQNSENGSQTTGRGQ